MTNPQRKALQDLARRLMRTPKLNPCGLIVEKIDQQDDGPTFEELRSACVEFAAASTFRSNDAGDEYT